jgi:hypothetical protein
MGRFNGCRAQKTRERKEKQASHQNVAKSQLKSNQAAQNIVCKLCNQALMCSMLKIL